MTTTHMQGLTVDAARRRLTCGRTTLYLLIHNGLLRPVKIGRRTIIPEAQIDALLETGATNPKRKMGVSI